MGKDSKTGDKVIATMFVGYAKCKSANVKMWDPNTNRVVVSCGVIWLGSMDFQQDCNVIVKLSGL